MPRVYVRKPGSRAYVNYTASQLQKAITAVKSRQMSIRKASR